MMSLSAGTGLPGMSGVEKPTEIQPNCSATSFPNASAGVAVALRGMTDALGLLIGRAREAGGGRFEVKEATCLDAAEVHLVARACQSRVGLTFVERGVPSTRILGDTSTGSAVGVIIIG